MDFEINSDLKEFIDTVRQFREREMMPLEHQFLMDGDWPEEVRQNLEKRARSLGFWALDVPENLGGQG